MSNEADQFTVIGCAIVALLAVWVGSGIWTGERLDRNFARVNRGMTDQQVIALLGMPKSRGRCGAGYYNFVEPTSGSEECLVYADPFAPLIPEYPVVYLDRANRVVDKFNYESP